MRKPTLLNWPVLRQFEDLDLFGRDKNTKSRKSEELTPRTHEADGVYKSVCPYCAVGCGQRIFVKNNKVVQIEGDPDSPISRGRLCPKGSATEQMINAPGRHTEVLYRAPHATEWTHMSRDKAVDMIVDRILASRKNGWQDVDDQGRVLNRTMGFAGLGGAVLDNEENYLIKKLFTALGAVQIENVARI
ncbi:Molybdopterin oxidoreductase Fe4S4 domain [Corynebacterium uterequi]|uniref:Molybdopterin oxidoreductase Fe4S4 domain n=1 Tax=Corynebacterium uterequi TaxID=1072256 RepID=A0A0G3HF19_9CORY|nr:Molybdopterin oxidoreductase Fe4S4 domain [Corynebacterium uterequi]